MKTNATVIWVVAILALVLIGGFFLFRDGTGGLPTPVSEEIDDTEMATPAPDADGVDETVVSGEAMEEDGGAITGEGSSPTVPSSSDENGGAGASAAEITYTGGGFAPAVLNVAEGDTVVFVNNSGSDFWPASAIHPTHSRYDGTILSQHCPGNSFDACGGIAPGASWSFTFNKAGEWTYHDHLNPRNIGRVVVE